MFCLPSLEGWGSLWQLVVGSPILLLSMPSLLLPISFPAGCLLALAHLLFHLTQLDVLVSVPELPSPYRSHLPSVYPSLSHPHPWTCLSFSIPGHCALSNQPISYFSPFTCFTSLCSSFGSSTASPFTLSPFGSIHYLAINVRLEGQLQLLSIVLQARGP